MIIDYITLTVNSLIHRKVRAWLTILGIVIGVAAIIALISVSQGLKSSVEEQFETFGASRLIVAPKSFQSPGTPGNGLTTDDVATLKQISEFKYVTPMLGRSAEIEYKKDLSKESFERIVKYIS